MTLTSEEHRAELWRRIAKVGEDLELFASLYNVDMSEQQRARRAALFTWIRQGHLLRLIALAVELDKAVNATQETG